MSVNRINDDKTGHFNELPLETEDSPLKMESSRQMAQPINPTRHLLSAQSTARTLQCV